MIKTMALALCVAMMAGMGTPAAAIDASSIIIRSAFPDGDWLQIGELQVFANGVNVAAAINGGVAYGTGSYDGTSTPDKANDGIVDTNFPQIYHSDGAGTTEYLEIKFTGMFDVSDIVIFGRGDCCSERNYFSYELHGTNQFGDYLAWEGVLDARNGSFSASDHVPNDNGAMNVPEPASWAMMLAGFGAVGGAMRRRRVAAAC